MNKKKFFMISYLYAKENKNSEKKAKENLEKQIEEKIKRFNWNRNEIKIEKIFIDYGKIKGKKKSIPFFTLNAYPKKRRKQNEIR